MIEHQIAALQALLAAEPIPTYSIFEAALRAAGPWAAGLTVVVGLSLAFIRLGLLPLLRHREEALKSRRRMEEERDRNRHEREMELETVRLQRDKANAECAVATNQSMEKAEKIAELLSTTTEAMGRFIPALMNHTDAQHPAPSHERKNG